jgi:hypothetical protein
VRTVRRLLRAAFLRTSVRNFTVSRV